MEFRPEDYGPDIAHVLTLAGAGKRAMPLLKTEKAPGNAKAAIEQLTNASIAAGLYLHCGYWDAGHTAADSVQNPNGYFWHGIAHRQEPDPDNAAYWFRMTGKHAIFPRLAAEAATAGYRVSGEWDPFAFIQFCESARRQAGSAEEQLAMRVQLLEWQLLFDYCARGANG
jgi:hypothetical protein